MDPFGTPLLRHKKLGSFLGLPKFAIVRPRLPLTGAPHMSDDLKAALNAMSGSEQMQATADYVARGRIFQAHATQALKARWIIAMRDWASRPEFTAQPTAMADAEAELSLRGER